MGIGSLLFVVGEGHRNEGTVYNEYGDEASIYFADVVFGNEG